MHCSQGSSRFDVPSVEGTPGLVSHGDVMPRLGKLRFSTRVHFWMGASTILHPEPMHNSSDDTLFCSVFVILCHIMSLHVTAQYSCINIAFVHAIFMLEYCLVTRAHAQIE